MAEAPKKPVSTPQEAAVEDKTDQKPQPADHIHRVVGTDSKVTR